MYDRQLRSEEVRYSHVEFKETPVQSSAKKKRYGYLICLSAQTEEALRQKEHDLALWLDKKGGQCDIADLYKTFLLGRTHFKFKTVYVVRDILELHRKLKGVHEKDWAI